jgi:hypothetical protein
MICALLAVVFTVLCVQPQKLQAATISSSILAGYGFAVDTSCYEDCYMLPEQSTTLRDTEGKGYLNVTTRVWVLRDNISSYGDYNDVVLVWTHLEPLSFNRDGLTIKGYPESLKSTFFPPEYCTSSPKTQVVSTSYSVGGNVGVGEGFSAGISGSVTTVKDCLVISNQSSPVSDRSELFYDYRPGPIVNSKFDYIGKGTQQLGITYIHSKITSYPIVLASTVKCGFTELGIVYGESARSITQNRSFRPSFSTTDNTTPNPFADDKVSYKTHVQDYGWQNYVSNGAVSGTSGESKRLEALRIKLENMSGSVQYRTHVQDIGWMSWVANDALSGTTGQSKRLEAIQISLTGDAAKAYDIYYSVHAQNMGWMDWAKNGESAGTSGFGYRLEAIKIVLVRKGGSAPGATARAFVQG